MPNAASQRRSLFQHRIEHRREIAGRGIDDLQDFGGRGLPAANASSRSTVLARVLSKLTLEIGDDLLRIV